LVSCTDDDRLVLCNRLGVAFARLLGVVGVRIVSSSDSRLYCHFIGSKSLGRYTKSDFSTTHLASDTSGLVLSLEVLFIRYERRSKAALPVTRCYSRTQRKSFIDSMKESPSTKMTLDETTTT
jgi:hypothetical protein